MVRLDLRGVTEELCAIGQQAGDIMKEDGVLNLAQSDISMIVEKCYNSLSKVNFNEYIITHQCICDLIDLLASNCAPGGDGVTSEHLKYGKSNILCTVLSNLFTSMLSWLTLP